MKVSPTDVLAEALQRARRHLNNLKLRIDLNKVINDRNMNFRPMAQRTRNRLNDTPNGIIEVSPDAILELAAVVGHSQKDLTRYLCKFTPGPDPDEAAA